MARGYNRIYGRPTWHGSKYRKRATVTRKSSSSYSSGRRSSSGMSGFIARSIVRCIFR